ncbi:hypothetical protein N7468_004906 [Penicillium chermesinum]|uniref:Uncharacterized protein n=1 Tax=Penicillium chermesinum TaxID=63820 RepID=A0A9W9P9H8_9EURO|nr:uncharacterized protein N7468_004906 [Penicillium chermesinum]KAJ5240287.1 hypothetical protein N7468_004906 [Penicillium chermesinum]KAJ6167155.1 hypothetical protein N7470_002602 [Penicillium chermesinum]
MNSGAEAPTPRFAWKCIMKFAIDHILAVIDSTILNPVVSALIPIGLHFTTIHRVIFQHSENSIFRLRIAHLPLIQKNALYLLAAGVLIRLNRYFNQRALNNGVSAKFEASKEIIVVTGGAGGFGAEATKRLASRGSKVVVLDVLPLTYDKPPNVHYYKVDVTKYEAVQAVAELIRKDVGAPTVVIANAGICRGKGILEARPEDIEMTFAVNNLAIFWCAKVFLPSMVKNNHGHFLITASQGGYACAGKIVDYSATKAAAIAIYEGLQTELKHIHNAPGVRVSVISPSVAQTRMFETTKSPSNFILPRLEASDVGQKMCEIIWSAKSQEVLIPAAAYIAVPTRSLPTWMRVGLQNTAATSFSDFKPHDPLALGK